MGENALPPLTDNQIELLFTICKAASTSIRPPFAALSKAYDAEFERYGLNTSRDNAIFRWIMRLGEIARQRHFLEAAADYSQLLRDALQAQGITLIDQTSQESESEHELNLDQTQLDQMEAGAVAHDRRTLLRQSIDALRTAWEPRRQEKERLIYLENISRDAQQRRDASLVGRAFAHWKGTSYGRHQDSIIAATISHRRLLHSLIARWNGAARARVVADIIDNRVVVDMFYRWLTLARLRMFQRRHNARLLRSTTAALRSCAYNLQNSQFALEQGTIACATSQRDKLLRLGMQKLHLALREQEDAQRIATESTNARIVPNVLATLKDRSDHLHRLENMATDYRFWFSTTRALRKWRTQCKENRHQRMVERYAQMRTKIKTRMAKGCLSCLRAKVEGIHSLDEEAKRIAQARIFRVGTNGFDTWHGRAVQVIDLNNQASQLHLRHLEKSTLATLTNQHVELTVREQQAVQFRQESDLACAAGALKKMQWAAFTSKRQAETAEALRERNERQHVKQMLKYMVAQTVTRRAVHTDLPRVTEEQQLEEQGDPDSPSLRPATRLAARSADSSILSHLRSQGPIQASTPAYLQTPARSRRVVRFRPLPTPAPFTPFRLPEGE